ncbi:DNA-binding protein [Coleofasciculus sp. H7-2]|uniref:DNA-binding protein n=1 Tax=Coleofasciculus sp. H7-2 TaxID=3351545 RepID=UPI00366ED766
MSVQEKIQLSLDVSTELYQTLETLAQKISGNKKDKAVANVLLKAITLMEIAVKAEEESKSIWIADKDEKLDTKIVGISPQ